MIPAAPDDWAQLHWHRVPGPARYHSRETAQRACNWLNNSEGKHEVWLFRPGRKEGLRWSLERRWIGQVLGLLDLQAGPFPPPGDGDVAEGS